MSFITSFEKLGKLKTFIEKDIEADKDYNGYNGEEIILIKETQQYKKTYEEFLKVIKKQEQLVKELANKKMNRGKKVSREKLIKLAKNIYATTKLNEEETTQEENKNYIEDYANLTNEEIERYIKEREEKNVNIYEKKSFELFNALVKKEPLVFFGYMNSDTICSLKEYNVGDMGVIIERNKSDLYVIETKEQHIRPNGSPLGFQYKIKNIQEKAEKKIALDLKKLIERKEEQ